MKAQAGYLIGLGIGAGVAGFLFPQNDAMLILLGASIGLAGFIGASAIDAYGQHR